MSWLDIYLIVSPAVFTVIGAFWVFSGLGKQFAAEYRKGVEVGYRAGLNDSLNDGATAKLIADVEAAS